MQIRPTRPRSWQIWAPAKSPAKRPSAALALPDLSNIGQRAPAAWDSGLSVRGAALPALCGSQSRALLAGSFAAADALSNRTFRGGVRISF